MRSKLGGRGQGRAGVRGSNACCHSSGRGGRRQCPFEANVAGLVQRAHNLPLQPTIKHTIRDQSPPSPSCHCNKQHPTREFSKPSTTKKHSQIIETTATIDSLGGREMKRKCWQPSCPWKARPIPLATLPKLRVPGQGSGDLPVPERLGLPSTCPAAQSPGILCRLPPSRHFWSSETFVDQNALPTTVFRASSRAGDHRAW